MKPPGPNEGAVELRNAMGSPLPVSEIPMAATAVVFKGPQPNGSVVVSTLIGAPALELQEQDGVFRNHLELAVAATNQSGKTFSGGRNTLDLNMKPDTAKRAAAMGFRVVSSIDLPPGRYTLRIGARENNTKKSGSVSYDLEVPDFQVRDLALSSITLAERLEPAAGSPNPNLKSPFVFGSLRVLPKPGIAYAQDQDFAFYFQVYQARADAASGKPLLDVRYSFLRRDDQDEYQPIGPPLELIGRDQGAQGYAFPLAAWPIGQYRLRVEVTDRLSGQRAERSADFVVR